MATTIKARRIGDSLGLILPKEAADQLHVVDGDGLHLTPLDPDFDAAMESLGQTRGKYRNALRARQVIEKYRDHRKGSRLGSASRRRRCRVLQRSTASLRSMTSLTDAARD